MVTRILFLAASWMWMLEGCMVVRSFSCWGTISGVPPTTTPRRTAISNSDRSRLQTITSANKRSYPVGWKLMGSLDNKDDGDDDEDDDDEDDEDEDDEYENFNDAAVEGFRNRISTLYEGTIDNKASTTASPSSVDALISYARNQGKDTSVSSPDSSAWANPIDVLELGTVLVANPAKFCADFGDKPVAPAQSLLSKFGLTLPPPADLGPDRRADLLPVLILVEKFPLKTGYRAMLLNRRTGYLLGDLEQPRGSTVKPPAPSLERFYIQPLWFGGVDNMSSGLDMLHLCESVSGASKITDDGLYYGGDPSEAQAALSDTSLGRVLTGFDFKFFVQNTVFGPFELERAVQSKTFLLARVSKDVIFRPRDRRSKPLWTEIMELMGPPYRDIRDTLYEDKRGFS